MHTEDVYERALTQFNSGNDDTGDEVLEFLLKTAYTARYLYVLAYAELLLKHAPQQESDMPFKTMGEFISEQASSSEM